MPFDPSSFADISPLTLRVPLGIREAPTSLCSRLAAWNGRSMAAFCADMKIAVRSLLDGGTEALAKLAALGGIDLAELTRSAIRSPDPTQVAIGGERLAPSNMRRRWTRGCPACLAEDIAGRPDVGEAAPYGRTAWMVEAVRTCPVHRVALAHFDNPECHDGIDFTAWIRPHIGRLDTLAATAPKREPSGLETYLLNRLAGRAPGRALERLDAMPLHAVISTTGIVGALASGDHRQKPTDDELHSSDGAGFEILSRGAVGIHEALDRRVRCARDGSGRFDVTAVYGELYEHLTRTADDPGYEAVRRAVRDHLLGNLPVGADEIVFGQPVGRRRLHSIKTAAWETGAYPSLLRTLLAAADVLPFDHESHTDDRVTFRVERAAAVLDQARQRMRLHSAAQYDDRPRLLPLRNPYEELPLPAAAKYANMSQRQLMTICEADLAKPCGSGRGMRRFRKIEKGSLYRFLKLLHENAVAENGRSERKLTDIPSAARLAGCSVPRLLELALDGYVTSLSRPADGGGYMSLRLDPEEVRYLVSGTGSGGLTVHDVAKRLRIRSDAVRGLARSGHLRSGENRYPRTGIRQTVFSEGDVAKFDLAFVALVPLAASRKAHVGSLRNELERMGIQPAFSPRFVGAIFYRRVDLPT